MAQGENRIHFRKTLYFRIIIGLFILGITFFAALFCLYHVSCRQFEEGLAYHSDTLAEQICQNADITLREMAESAVPLETTNAGLAPILREVQTSPLAGYPPYLRLRIESELEAFMAMDYNVRWMAVVDRREQVYLICHDSRVRGDMPDAADVKRMYETNRDNLSDRSGNTVWIGKKSMDGAVLMRSVFDTETMSFCGTIMAEVELKPLEQIFEGIESSRAGVFTIYDRNGQVLYSTGSIGDVPEENVIQTKYPIGRGRLSIVNQVDIGQKNQRSEDLLRITVCIGLAVVAVAMLLIWIMFGQMAKNMKILLENVQRVARGEFAMLPTHFVKGGELEMVALNVQEMAGRIKGLMEQEVQNKELQEQNRYQFLEMRYHELQSQVNPHFLFNILQSINGIALLNGDRQVSRLICLLSKFFRGNVDRRHTSCPLSEELAYVSSYLELYRSIYPDRLQIQWDVDQSLLSVDIPTYILQPIVENSLVHGMEPSLKACTIRISAAREGENMAIEIWDNGEGIEPGRLRRLQEGKEKSKRIGIRNVQDRIRIMYGKEYGLTIRSEYHKYTQVRICLPISGH